MSPHTQLPQDAIAPGCRAVYRADIDKTSGWRIHVQYEDGQVHLKDVIEGRKHDDVLGQIEAKKVRYARKKKGE